MADQEKKLSCETCGKERFVSRTMVFHHLNGVGRNCKSCALRGNKRREGTYHSAETREKMRMAKLGKKNSAEHNTNIAKAKIGKPIPSIRGDKHYNWKGGTRRRTSTMQQAEYSKWRRGVFDRDNYTCQICEQYGGYLHADHIKSWKDHEDLRLEVSNGRTLCVPCHYYITFKKKMPIGALWCNYRMTKKAG